MRNVKFRAGNKDEVALRLEGLVIAVDIGFSNGSKSCGLAWEPSQPAVECKDKYFDECLDKVESLILENDAVTLILEAPLSACFEEHMFRPKGREFEKVNKTEDEKGTHRYWYEGSGAVVTLGAMFFLQELKRRLESSKTESPKSTGEQKQGEPGTIVIHLFEGLHTNKRIPESKGETATKVTPETKPKRTHFDDAQDLLEWFRDSESESSVGIVKAVEPLEGGHIVPLLSFVGITDTTIPPVVRARLTPRS